MTCVSFNSSRILFSLLLEALAEIIINGTQKNIPHYVISNTCSIRFDTSKELFTCDNVNTISPISNSLLYILEVPCSKAATLLDRLNNDVSSLKSKLESMCFELDICVNPIFAPLVTGDESSQVHHTLSAMTRR